MSSKDDKNHGTQLKPKTSKEDLQRLKDSSLNGYNVLKPKTDQSTFGKTEKEQQSETVNEVGPKTGPEVFKMWEEAQREKEKEQHPGSTFVTPDGSVGMTNAVSSGESGSVSLTSGQTDNIDDSVNFWVAKIKQSAAADGEMKLPTEREIALQAQLGSCDDHTPCDRKTYQIRKAIMERLVEDARPQSFNDAYLYWSFKTLLGQPVPTKDQILAKGFGDHACMQTPDKCDQAITALLKLLEANRQQYVSQARFGYNQIDELLRLRSMEQT
eukprot:jgi/Mesvir1/26914/Mv20641-RA.1